MISSFSVENYKAFARRQEIEIRPLTLFFGWNSGGKSALIRFLPLISESIRGGGPPIWLSGAVGRSATWPELVSKATGRGNLRFSLKWEEPNLESEWDIAGDLEGRWQEVRSLSLSLRERSRAIDGPECRWAGLLPTREVADNADVGTLRTELEKLTSQVQWISGLRTRPPRIETYGGGVLPTLSSDGRDAVSHLVAAQLRSSADPILEITGRFFNALGQQLVLDSSLRGAWSLMLHPAGSSQIPVSLGDTGEGYAQVLPVLVALARAQASAEAPQLLCIEQPELHLHTRAQAELAHQFASFVNQAPNARLLLETHSEVLLTSLQLAVASGQLDPSMLRVYWVEARPNGTSEAIKVDFDDKGRPLNSVLSRAFSEAVEIGHALLAKQLERTG